MATYTHFGKQPDVLKHLILCEVLRNEHPQVYVETNSACAIYPMQQTSEQQYGIYYFLEKAVEEDNQVLKDSIYYKIENAEMQRGYYLGSPALAMEVLGRQAQRFLFFDIEKSALDNVERYAKQAELQTSVHLYNTDSLEGVMKLLPSLPKDSFIHIDPYEIDKKGDSGVTYLDILIQATQLGMKCLLWYGFMTGDDKASLDNYITSSLEKAGIKDFFKGKHGRNFLLALDVLLAIAFFAQPDLYYDSQAPDFFDRFYADSLIICGGLWAVLVFLTGKKIHF